MLKLESATLVLVGKFNPYIVSPEWLEGCGIWSAVDTRLNLGAAGDDGVRFRGNHTDWEVTSGRLAIASIAEDCGELASRVLKQLPHTPMEQSLFTYSFSVAGEPLGQVFDLIESTCTENNEESKPELIRWGLVTHDGGARADLMFVRGEEGTTISVIRRRSTKTAKAAIDAVEKFAEDRSKSESLINRILGGSA